MVVKSEFLYYVVNGVKYNICDRYSHLIVVDVFINFVPFFVGM